MRILMLSDRIPPENIGGAEKIAWALARGLQRAGHELHVVAATEKASFDEVRDGIPTYHLHSVYPSRWTAYYAVYNPQTVGAVKRLYQRIKPDLVCAYNIHTQLSYACLWTAHRMDIPVTLTVQDVMSFAYNKLTHFIDPARCGVTSPNDYRLPALYNFKTMRLRYNPMRNLAIRYILRHAVKARVAGSEALRQALEANGLPSFEVVHAGIVPSDFEASNEDVAALRAKLGLEGRKIILFSGRLTRDKGSEQLLQALDRVVKTVPEAVLLMLSRASLENQGLDQYPQLMPFARAGGWMQGRELAAAYHLADVVVVPSICLDVFPTVILEAMAVRRPVIATCYGGAPESVIDGETGFIVNPFDTATFAERLTQLLTDSDLRETMGAAGQARLLNHFTETHYVAEMARIFEHTVDMSAEGA